MTTATALRRILRQPFLLILAAVACLASVLVSNPTSASAETAPTASVELRQVGSNLCLSLGGPQLGKATSSAVLAVCNDYDPNQQFRRFVNSNGSVSYALTDGTNKCINNYTGTDLNGNQLVAWDCATGGSAGQWNEYSYAPTSMTIHNVKTDKCIDTASGAINVGAKVVQGVCHSGSRTQLWQLVQDIPERGSIRQTSSGLCFLYMWGDMETCSASSTQFDVQPLTGGGAQFFDAGTHLCFAVHVADKPFPGSKVFEDECAGDWTARWYVHPHASGIGWQLSVRWGAQTWCLDVNQYAVPVIDYCTSSMKQSFTFPTY